MNSKPILCTAVLMLTTLGAGAQTQQPGLWEHTTNMKAPGGEADHVQAEMQKQMAAMPPEQRKQVEQMMAGRGMTMGPQGNTVKVCITKEQAARPAEPRMQGDCTQKDLQRSGNTVKFKFECSTPRPTRGEGEWTFVSDKAYTGRTVMTTEVKGQPQPMTVEMSGQWISADCGDVRPRAAPAK